MDTTDFLIEILKGGVISLGLAVMLAFFIALPGLFKTDSARNMQLGKSDSLGWLLPIAGVAVLGLLAYFFLHPVGLISLPRFW